MFYSTQSSIRSIYSFNPLFKPLKFSSKVYWQPVSLETRLTLTLLSRWKKNVVACWTSDVVSCCLIASYDVWPTQVPNIDNSYAIIPVNSYLWIVQLLPLGACSQPPALFLLKKPFKHTVLRSESFNLQFLSRSFRGLSKTPGTVWGLKHQEQPPEVFGICLEEIICTVGKNRAVQIAGDPIWMTLGLCIAASAG